MPRKNEIQALLEEIALLIQYAVCKEDQVIATAVVEKYRENRVALQVLREFYTSLPEAREEPLTRIVRMDMRQGIYLLGASTGNHDYVFFATESEAGCLGEYHQGIDDIEIQAFFGYSSEKSYLELHPTLAGFDDFVTVCEKPSSFCPVCSVSNGEFHHLGCPVEICPWCFGQLSRCNCRFDLMQKESMEDEADLEQFEALLGEKGRICFEPGQGPSYPTAGEKVDLKQKK